ncbi:MAG: adenylyltransferase/cytidyltransferase family protein [Actinomycetota bacterium]|nr:adenylyltransferase/cytidyltransferase family protein [Actinomycetota bacterium]
MIGSGIHVETPSWGCVHGRFQPFHDGHLEYVLRARQRCERLIIGITAADPAGVRKENASPHRHEPASNPFTYFERLQMIQDTLLAEDLNPSTFAIVPFPIQDPGLIGHYVPKGTTQFVRVYSSWEEEKARRLRDEGFPVVVLDSGEEKKVSGSEVRRLMREGLPWEHLVPRSAAEVVRWLLVEDPSRLRGSSEAPF